MHPELHHFQSRLSRTVALALLPVVLVALLSMPAALHRHADAQPVDPNAPVAHMT